MNDSNNEYPEIPRIPVYRPGDDTSPPNEANMSIVPDYSMIPRAIVDRSQPDLKPEDVLPQNQNLPEEQRPRSRSHALSVGGVLAELYRSLVSNITNGSTVPPHVFARLMNKYLANCAKDDPSFNKTNTRGNLSKELSSNTMTFRALCRALIFWEFKKATIRIDGEREDGSTPSASIDVIFSIDGDEDSKKDSDGGK